MKTFEKNMISVKKENLFASPITPLETAVLTEMSHETKESFFQELINRTYSCHVDINKSETWSNVVHLYSKYALVTCLNTSYSRKRAPFSWKDSLELAYNLLLDRRRFLRSV